jgi:phosphatidylethanolamine-binding protein
LPPQASLIQVDPDAPSPQNRTLSDILHIVAGGMSVTGPKDADGFRVLTNSTLASIDYFPPGPPAGSPPHRYVPPSLELMRYVILLYTQPANFSQQKVVTSMTSRLNFNVTKFETAVGLAPPIGGNMFYVGPATATSGTGNVSSTGVAPAATSTQSVQSGSHSQFELIKSGILVASMMVGVFLYRSG